jgi:RNA polymerase sigma factor (sigma-70 family)
LSQIKNDNITTGTINGCRQNDSNSQRQLYDMTVKQLYNVVYRVVADHHYTQDVLQESFIKIFKKIDQYDEGKGNVYGWMCKICINQSINFLRSRRLVFEEVDQLFVVPEGSVNALEKMDAEYILKLMALLPMQSRIIFNLYEIEGYNHSEIAALLDINVNSCRAYLSRAKSKLQEMIINQQDYYKTKSVS